MTDPPEDALLGTLIDGRYRVLRLIGRGGMGTVYEVEHELIGERFALKTLHPAMSHNAQTVARFLREARIAGTLDTKRIVRVTDMGKFEDGAPFLVMELLRGRDLGQVLEAEGSLPLSKTIALALEVCDALSAAHAGGIVHRDLKPENIFLSHDAEHGHGVTLLDFGISKLLPTADDDSIPALTRTGAIIGTPDYMAPEQVLSAKSVDARADVYALGVVLYHCLSGRLPFDAPTPGAMLAEIVQGRALSLSDAAGGVDPVLERVVMRALERDPAERYPSVAALAEDLRGLMEEPGPSTNRSARLVEERRGRGGMGRNVAIVAAALVSGLIGFAAVVWLLQQGWPAPAEAAEASTPPVAPPPIDAALPMLPSAPRAAAEASDAQIADTAAASEEVETTAAIATPRPRMTRRRHRTMVNGAPASSGRQRGKSPRRRIVRIRNGGDANITVVLRCAEQQRVLTVPAEDFRTILLPPIRCDVRCTDGLRTCPSELSPTGSELLVH